MSTTNTISVLNDLIEINNDRVAGFEKAIASLDEANVDLKQLFEEYAEQSRKFRQQLSAVVATYNGEAETGSSLGGTLHRAWMDIKSLFTMGDRESILSEAETGEDAIKAAYEKALHEEELPVDVIQLLTSQAEEIRSSHDNIRTLRDTEKEMN